MHPNVKSIYKQAKHVLKQYSSLLDNTLDYPRAAYHIGMWLSNIGAVFFFLLFIFYAAVQDQRDTGVICFVGVLIFLINALWFYRIRQRIIHALELREQIPMEIRNHYQSLSEQYSAITELSNSPLIRSPDTILGIEKPNSLVERVYAENCSAFAASMEYSLEVLQTWATKNQATLGE